MKYIKKFLTWVGIILLLAIFAGSMDEAGIPIEEREGSGIYWMPKNR